MILLCLVITCFFCFLLESNFIFHVKLKHKIKAGVKNNEFRPFYQPIKCTQSNQVIGYESLIRWIRPNKIISPLYFIDAVERFHLIESVTKSLLDQVYADLSSLPNDQWISINIPPSVLESQFLINYLKNNNYRNAENIKFEITEREPIKDFCILSKHIDILKSKGFEFSIDDFGEGFCDISYVQQLSINYIKIDRSMVKDLTNNKQNQDFLDAISQFCQRLNLKVIIEGVEDQETAQLLDSLGLHFQQGFYHGKPQPATFSIYRIPTKSITCINTTIKHLI